MKPKASLLAAALVLAGVTYVPQASATVVSLGVIGVAGGVGIAGGAPAASPGPFTDYFNFQVSAPAGVGATAISWKWGGQGVELSKLSLYSGLSGTGSSLASFTPTANPSGTLTFYSGALSHVGFMPSQWYSLKVEGVGYGANGMYNGSVVTAPIPEPEEWAMLLVGAGLVGFQVRNKQKKLEKTFIG